MNVPICIIAVSLRVSSIDVLILENGAISHIAQSVVQLLDGNSLVLVELQHTFHQLRACLGDISKFQFNTALEHGPQLL